MCLSGFGFRDLQSTRFTKGKDKFKNNIKETHLNLSIIIATAFNVLGCLFMEKTIHIKAKYF
jgi:hypothetical protein